MKRLVAVLLCALCTATLAHARTLSEIQARGVVSQCANPDALPHSSSQSDPPGYQIELGRAIAQSLHVKHEVAWIISRLRAGLVDCDILLDTIVAPGTEPGPLKVSRPYQRSGVALAVRGASQPVRGFADIAPGQRIGVMIESLASKVLGQRGVHTVPYAFERDMIDDLGKGEIDGCAATPATIQYYMHAHPNAGLRYAAAYESEPQLQWTLAVGMRRSDDALVRAVNAALDDLATSGTLERIYARYGIEYRRP